MQAKLLSTFGPYKFLWQKTKQYQLDSRIEICKGIAIIGKLKKKKKNFCQYIGEGIIGPMTNAFHPNYD